MSTSIEISHGGKTVKTTMKGLNDMADELEGMPDPVPHVIEKVTGTLSEGYSDKLPEIDDKVSLKLDLRVKAITERRNKDHEVEYVVTFETTKYA